MNKKGLILNALESSAKWAEKYTKAAGLILLTVIFIVLKALGYMDWSWFWVFSPLIAVVGIIVIGALVVLILEWIPSTR